MRIAMLKKLAACIFALLSVFNITPFTPAMVARWIAGSEYCDALPAEKAEMLLDLYVNQDFIYLDEAATKLTKDVLSEILIEIISSEGSGANILAALRTMPVYERGQVDTSRESFTPDTPEKLRLKVSLRKLVESSFLPEEVKTVAYYFTDGINDVRIYFLKTEHEGVYEFAGDLVRDDGTVATGNTGVYYDSESTLIYGVNKAGIFQIGFDFKAGDIMMTNPVNAWQRRYGFNILYDILGNVVLIDTNTVRVRFNYGGKNKMIQFWKGNYTRISNGAEIGIYNRNENFPLLYDCIPDEEMLYMSMKLYHGDELILQNGRQKHWWLSGYQPGETIKPRELTLDCTIEFPDREMLDAFMTAAKKAFGKRAGLTADGLTAHIIW